MRHLYFILILFVVLMASCGSYYLVSHGRSHVVTSDTLDIDRVYNYTNLDR